jgi:hypothetical protein
MRNATVVFAVLAVMAMAVPAYGAVWAVWDDGGADDSWYTGANWRDWYNNSNDYAPVVSGDRAYIDTGCTPTTPVLISAVGGSITVDRVYLGYGSTSGTDPGYLKMTTGTLTVARFLICYSYSNSSIFTHEGGDVSVGTMIIGDSGAVGGKYTISGGGIAATVIYTGDDVPDGTGSGTFEVVGTGSTGITTGSYNQNAYSTLGVTLDSAGVDVISVSNDATLAGTLVFDATAYTGTGTVIDILQAGSDGSGTLTYTGLSLDAASTTAGYTLGDDGNGMLQVTIPEPATMALLGIGGIGALLRRRRK